MNILQQPQGQKRQAYSQATAALGKWWLPIPALLQNDFLLYQYRQNADFLIGINIFAHTCFFLYTFANYLIVPDIFWLDLPIRAFLLLTLLPLFLWLIKKVHNIAWVELLLPISALIGTLVWFKLLTFSHSEHVQTYLYASVVFVIAINLGIRTHFISGVLCSLLLSVIILYYVHLLSHPDGMALFVFCLVYAPILVFGLFISWHNTYNARKLFLYAVTDELTKAELWEANRLLMVKSHTDSLTSLPNRALFEDRIHQAITKATRNKTKLALMIVDLDNFKPINDTYGHKVGDNVLQEAAKRMVSCVRESDTVARIGGDEFIILLPVVEAQQDAEMVAEKIRDVLSQPIAVDKVAISGSSSVGIALYPEQGGDVETLFRNADQALYRAKSQGRNRVEMAGMA